MSKNIDKFKLKALLPTTQGTYNMILSSLTITKTTVETQLTVLKSIMSKNDDTESMPDLDNQDIKTEFLVSLANFNDLLSLLNENILANISYVKDKRSFINSLTDEVVKNNEVNADEIFDNIDDIIDTIAKSLGTPSEIKKQYEDCFTKSYQTFGSYSKAVIENYEYSSIKKEHDKINNDFEMLKHLSASVIDSINVIDTCLVLIKALIDKEQK